MDATKRRWAITNESSAYMDGNIIVCENIEIAGVWEKEDAELIVRAVNTFDQAREALKIALRAASQPHGMTPKEVILVQAALAAMEGRVSEDIDTVTDEIDSEHNRGAYGY